MVQDCSRPGTGRGSTGAGTGAGSRNAGDINRSGAGSRNAGGVNRSGTGSRNVGGVKARMHSAMTLRLADDILSANGYDSTG